MINKTEINRIKKKIKLLSKDQQILAMKMLDEITWMGKTLDTLKEQVDASGPVYTAVNGNGFEITQEHPAQRSYNSMIKNYSTVMKQLLTTLPEDTGEQDELEQFLAGK